MVWTKTTGTVGKPTERLGGAQLVGDAVTNTKHLEKVLQNTLLTQSLSKFNQIGIFG